MIYYVWVNGRQLHAGYPSVEEACSFIQRCCIWKDRTEVRDETGKLYYASQTHSRHS